MNHGCKRSSNLVGIKTKRLILRTPDSSCQTATVTKMDSDDTVRLSRHDPQRQRDGSALLIDEFDQRHVMFAALHCPVERNGLGPTQLSS